MKFSNKDLVELDQVLTELETVKTVSTAWAVARNKANIESSLNDYRKLLSPTEAILRLQKAIRKLAEEHSERNPDGSPVAKTSGDGIVYQILNPDAYIEAVDVLRLQDEHKQAIEDEQYLFEKEAELRKESFVFEPFKLSVASIKEGDMNSFQMKVLYKAGILED